ncbi:chitin deacetylase 1 [Cokeromyces recurvatus]|uniref:chitin deacetylase 1 n=1 Tax=Cokeromyces recurvatus TaxID=90255 RepID=UPI00221E74DD|nr:chitin deacetylase 1 [Cokeromyces recurvatus]KAI7905691.1 chitin deacetylase 1 [Cokeromyces recurvatus]
MYIKIFAITTALLQVASFAQADTTNKLDSSTVTAQLSKPQDYWKNFKSLVDPNNITIPSIPQTTSTDPSVQCTYYQPPPNFIFNPSEWPNLWETATSNGMNETDEFKTLYNSINWTSAPNIPVRKLNPDGSLDMTGYDETTDTDCWWSATTCTKPKHENVNEDIYTCFEPETWGLTYDDGPNCSHNAFYDYLEAQQIKATMFYIGSNVVNWPYGAQRGQKNGHHLADHTWSHKLMTTLTNAEVLAELYYTQKAIKMVTGVTPKYWRPAFGDVDDRVRWIATQLDLTTVLWSLDTDDWAAGYSESIDTVKSTYESYIQMGLNGTFKNTGQITLTHEINNTTMSLALEFLPKIEAAYQHVINVATCSNISYPYEETTVKFPTFNETISGETSNTTNPTASSPSATINSQNGHITSNGIHINPNSLALAAFALAAYLL